MRKLTSLGRKSLVRIGGAILLAALLAEAGRAQDTFATAQTLTGVWGNVTYDNSFSSVDIGAPSLAGVAPYAPAWFQWTAPQDGDVELDTVGSTDGFLGLTLDTTLGVFTGTSVANLTQVAANDDLFPVSSSVPQLTYGSSADYIPLGGSFYPFTQPYYGPSHLHFTAKGGQTYYFAVDSKNTTGPIILNWAYQSSGVFRFATEDFDYSTGLPLYQTAQTESQTPAGTGNEANSVVLTYYEYNAPGALVTVTRSAGSVGRMTVDYTTVDGADLTTVDGTPVLSLAINDVGAVADTDYTPVSGTLVFDDYEMSKTILVPIIYNGLAQFQSNLVFGLQLSTPQSDPLESADVSTPRVDYNFSTAMVRILNVNADPYGPDLDTNGIIISYPTNNIFNFQKANYRVPADVNDGVTSPWTTVNLFVERFGTNTSAETIFYRVNNVLGGNGAAGEEQNIYFPLQPGSDYAVPTPAKVGSVRGINSDFDLATGTISFPARTGNAGGVQKISFTVPTSQATKFNKDFHVLLYREVAKGSGGNSPRLVGMVNEATVTILFNDLNPSAGSVDEFYNADFNSQLAVYASQIPPTTPPNNPNPGVGLFGEVYAMAVLNNGEALLGGDFQSYNGTARSCVALVSTTGQLDTTFTPDGGASAAVNAVAVSGSQFFVGGSFTSFNSQLVGRIARLNANGSLDTSFNPGLGADGTVRALAVLANGEVLIGGDFTHINGTARNHIALLNTDGTLDTSFNPGSNLSGPVYALAVQGSSIVAGGNFAVSGQLYKNIVRLNLNGSIDTAFSPGTGANGLVRALGWQSNGQLVVGGEFTVMNGSALNHIARLNSDGSVDSGGFFAGTGADDVVYSITLNTDGTIYVGGGFENFNGTHRRGFARLYANGTVDTTFMDTAYNQFAGLKKIYSWDSPAVLASAVQADGNVLIGGSFNQVGGGQANTNVCNTLDQELGISPDFGLLKSFDDPNLWVEPKTRDGVRNRSGFARLIGGATPGPGNLSLNQTSFSANKSSSSLTVSLVRTNGTLGPVSANFSVTPGTAGSGIDYTYDSAPPLYWVASQFITHPTRQRSDGLYGSSGFLVDPYGLSLTLADASINNLSEVSVSIIKNKSNPGNLNAQFQLANPTVADTFYLGSQAIPVGGALGVSTAPFTLIDDTTYPGTFGFSSATFTATNLSAPITVLRSNGVYGVVSMLSSSSNGTAVVGTDYVGVTNKSLIFGQNVTSNGFNVTIKNNGYITNVEKTVNLRLFNLGTTPGATFGISNSVLRIINPNYQGYVSLDATNYTGTISSGALTFVVNRVSGSLGSVTVQYATTNGSALNGTNYVGATNTLSWSSGDVTPRFVSIPLLNLGVVGTNQQFGVRLFSPTLNGVTNLALMGVISNATLVISNDNSYGVVQFAAPSYRVNENGGYATLTVLRTGGVVGTVSVNYATTNGPGATNGINFVGTKGTLILAPGQSSASFTVAVKDDGIADPANFYFNVTLSNPTNAVLGSPTNAQVNLFDVEAYNQPPGSADTAFNPDSLDANVFALALQADGKILAGGSFTAVGPVAKGRLARLGADGSLDTAFLNGLAGANAAVNALVCQTDGRILAGGAFTTLDGIHRNFVGRLMTDGSLDTSFNPGSGADNTVNALAETSIGGARQVYVGGAFAYFNGSSSPGIIRLNTDGSVNSGFSAGSGVDGQIYAVATYPTNSIYAGKVLIGGSFAHYNGALINNLARLNADGTLDTNFNAGFGTGPAAAVRALAIQTGGQVLVGGSFTNFNGTALNRLVRLNVDGTVDTNFVTTVGAAANGIVEGILLQPDNRIVVVGQFNQFNSVTRYHITRLLPTGATDPSINFGTGANGDVDAVVCQPADGMLVIGGAFSQYNGQPAGGIARIYGGSQTGSGAFTFTTANFVQDENGIFAPVTIRRTGGTSGTNADGSGEIYVQFATSDGTAKNGINYLGLTNLVDFPAGEVEKTVPVPVLDDLVITSNLTANLTLSSPTPPAGLTNQPTATLTILNDDAAVAFSSAFYTQAKNTPTGVAVIDVLRLGSTNGTASVQFYTTTNGTAIAGTDFYPTNYLVTFNPGQSDVPVTVGIINNGLVEGNRLVGMVLSNAVNTTLTSPSNATLTIIDTVAAPGQLYFSATNFTASSGDGIGYLTVLRTNGSSGAVSVTYTTVAGTAQPGINYISASGSLSFGSGETVKSVPVQLVNSPVPQVPVSLSVVLSSPTGGSTLTDPTNATITILSTNVGFAFQNGTNYVRETNGTVPIFVQRIGGATGGVQINYSTVGGSAHDGVNYSAVSGTLTFGAGEMLKAITLPLLYDARVTGDLRLTMSLSSPGAGAQLSSPSNTVVVVQDADAGLSFTNSTMSVFKNVGNAVITVVCTNPAVEPPVSDTNIAPMAVNYATVDGSAVAGVDYANTFGQLLFTNGIGTNTFTVPIYNNSLVLGNHSFSVILFSNTPPGQLVAPSNLVVNIVDNNSGLSFSSPSYSVLKSGVSATITVLRTDYLNTNSSVNFATADGTAVAGLDYFATNGVLNFTNGETSKTFPVTVIAGTTVQPDKTVLLLLSNPTNGFLIAPYAATLTIHDTSGSLVVPAGSTFAAGGDPNNNGLIDTNETVSLLLALRASGGTNVNNLSATLLATNGVIAPTSPNTTATQSYGSLVVNGPSVARQFTFTASGTNGQPIAATLQLNNGVTNLGTAVFTYTLGTRTTTYSNTNAIVINDNGLASPYPSTIVVSNLGGVVIKSVVTLSNLYHGYTRDIEALVVSPSAQDTLIMSHVGNGSAGKITLTFDDAAATSLTTTNLLVTGTNRPTAFTPTTTFP